MKLFPTLINHPKTLDLAARMRWSKFETAGRLISMWGWVLHYAPSGDLRKFTNSHVASAAEINPEQADAWVDALVSSRWIDRGREVFRLHNWLAYAGPYLRDSLFKRQPDKWKNAVIEAEKPVSVRRQSADSPPTVSGRGEEKRGEEKRREERGGLPDSGLPPNLQSAKFENAWREWLEYRAVKKPLSEKAIGLQLKKLSEWGVDRAVEAIETSMTNDWQGLFEPKSTKAKKPAADELEIAEVETTDELVREAYGSSK